MSLTIFYLFSKIISIFKTTYYSNVYFAFTNSYTSFFNALKSSYTIES